jgi:hypothetical protein
LSQNILKPQELDMVVIAAFIGATLFLFSWKFSVFIVQFGFYFLIWSRDRDIFPQFQSANSGVGKPDIVG